MKMTPEVSRKEWCKSNDVEFKDVQKVCTQLRTQYIYIRKALRGEPVPTELLERDLILLVRDSKDGRFPTSHSPHPAAKPVRPSV
jgi:hypothetical protein